MDLVGVERHARGVVRLVLAHGEARNAMGEALRGALLEVLSPLLQEASCRVLIVASGLKDFSVGGDLSRMDALSDPKAGREVMELLWSVVRERGITVLCVLHQLDLARDYADRLVGMRAGGIVFDRPAADVDDAEIHALYGAAPTDAGVAA